jgi:hypothetical protein
MAKSFSRFSGKIKILAIVLGAGLFALLGLFYVQDLRQRKAVITTDIIGSASSGSIRSGQNSINSSTKLATTDKLTFESKELATKNPKTTATVLQWSQAGPSEGVDVELRAFGDEKWSDWIDSNGSEGGRDDKPQLHSAIIISKDIEKVQYRFKLEGQNGQSSPTVDLSQAKIQSIDSSRGPSVSKETTWQKLTSSLKIEKTAQARSGQNAPRIYSRAEWGSPEPNSSPGWEPEYRRLGISFVHHTATTPTADSAAAVRAIWQYHTYSNGWGDIGYNYLVDQAGRIFEGRYYDHNYAEANDVDVVGGHVYGHNYGSTGISALGDFTNINPSAESLHAIAFTASYKLGAYNIDAGNGSHMIGHRDAGQTACPGARLYPQLPTIRAIATSVFPQYQIKPYAWQYAGQYAYTDQTKTTPVNLMNVTRGQRVYLTIKAKNVGSLGWSNTGANPVRVGTSQPQERVSPFCDNTWINCSRPTALQESDVPVGSTGTFEFWYKVPIAGGSYKEHFNLLAEDSMWMNDLGLEFGTYAQPPTYTYQPMGQYAYTDQTKSTPVNLGMLTPGQRVFVGINAKNTGNVTWTNTGDNPVRIGTANARERTSPFCDNTWINCRRPANLSEASVAPGSTGTFEFWYKAPANLAEYREHFTPVAEGIAWMNETGMNFLSRVVHPYLTIPDTDRMNINQQLTTGQSINSKDGRFKLILQGDGNLVLYTPQGPRWNSLTNLKPANTLVLQPDGNLVLYGNQGRAYWNSRTDTGNPTFLSLQNDGNLVLYNMFGRAIWFADQPGR